MAAIEKEKALDVVRQMVADGQVSQEVAEKYFPELAESEDERIRKEILTAFFYGHDNSDIYGHGITYGQVRAWLEKQGEKGTNGNNMEIPNSERKSANKVEPKFHKGDWVVYCNEDVDLITGIEENGYTINEGGYIPFVCASDIRLWTIQDAKDGDLIYVSTEEKGIQAIFYEYKNKTIFFHCYLCRDFAQGGYMPIGDVELVYPLQKTHYKRFFEKMHKAGYEWDAEKKELKKIEQKKPAWSEEDKRIILAVSQLLKDCESENGWNCVYSNDREVFFADIENYLQSLKNRIVPQPKQEWSEEDELIVAKILCICNDFERSFESSPSSMEVIKEDVDKIDNWLNSLKDRYTWKPSDEQIKVLEFFIPYVTKCSVVLQKNKDTLLSLLSDLKKLREE